jgi:D-alanyl-D-alanine carboxypeptidase
MFRMVGVILLVVVALLSAASGIVARQQFTQQQNAPGLPTLAKVHVLNQSRGEAVAVKITDAEPVSVTVTGIPVVSAQTQVVRQRWEYRTINIARGTDPSAQLNAAGIEFWETTGVQVPSTDGGLQVIVKRPRLQ